MYTRYAMMKLYSGAARWGEFCWKVIQLVAIAYVLYMALSMIYVGIVRDAEDRGAFRQKITNQEQHRSGQPARARVPKP